MSRPRRGGDVELGDFAVFRATLTGAQVRGKGTGYDLDQVLHLR